MFISLRASFCCEMCGNPNVKFISLFLASRRLYSQIAIACLSRSRRISLTTSLGHMPKAVFLVKTAPKIRKKFFN